MTDIARIDARRREVADAIYEDYDFGFTVVADSGWEGTSGAPGGDAWARTVFLEDPADPAGDSLRSRIAIGFAHGGAVAVSTEAAMRGEAVGGPMRRNAGRIA